VLNCHFHGENSLIQSKIFTAEPHWNPVIWLHGFQVQSIRSKLKVKLLDGLRSSVEGLQVPLHPMGREQFLDGDLKFLPGQGKKI
jgi:hypothetical protein